jgi:hypothetical protein
MASSTPLATGSKALNERRWGNVLCFMAVIATTPFNLVLGYFGVIGLQSASMPVANHVMILLPVLVALHVGLFAVLWAGVRYATRNRPAQVRSGATVLLTVLYLSVWLGWSAWEYVIIVWTDH